MKIVGIVLLAAVALAIVTGACQVQIFTVTTDPAAPGQPTRGFPDYGRSQSRAEAAWTGRVVAACSDLGAELARLTPATDRASLARHLRHVLALERTFAARVALIEPPGTYALEAGRAFAARHEWEKGLRRLVHAVVRSRKSKPVLRAGGALEPLAQRANLSFELLGLTDCLLPTSGIPG